MAKITAEFLKGKGVADAVVNEIIANLTSDYTDNAVIKEKYVDKATYDTEVSNSKTKLGNYDKALKEIQKIVGAEDETGIATKIGELKTQIATQDKEHKAELQRIERSHVDEKLLSESGALVAKSLTPFLSEIDASADIATYETMRKAQIETLKQGEDTKLLFKSQEQQQGNKPFGGAPLGDKGGQGGADNKNLTLEQQMALANNQQQ